MKTIVWWRVTKHEELYSMVAALGGLRTTGLNLSHLEVINSNKQAEADMTKIKIILYASDKSFSI